MFRGTVSASCRIVRELEGSPYVEPSTVFPGRRLNVPRVIPACVIDLQKTRRSSPYNQRSVPVTYIHNCRPLLDKYIVGSLGACLLSSQHSSQLPQANPGNRAHGDHEIYIFKFHYSFVF